jgi:hypothetical protein
MEDEREEEESIENEVYNLSEDEAKDMLIGYMIENKEAKRLLREAADFIDVIRFEEGEAIDENDLESEINKFLSE